MTITWENDCQVPTSGTPSSANTGSGTNIVYGGTNSALGAATSVGSGNTFQVETTSLPTVSGLTIARAWQYIQAAANQVTVYSDGSAGQAHYRWVSLFKLDAAPAASLTHLRFYTDVGHTAIAFSAQITTTRKVHVAENGGATSTDSTGVLTAGTWYSEVFEYDNATKIATLTYYTLGSASIVAQTTLTGVVGSYSPISCRHGIGTASAFTAQGVHRCLIAMGDQAVGRPDFANAVPIADAGPDQTVDAYDLVTLDASRSFDVDGTVASVLWTPGGGITLSSNTATNPTFTASATLTGSTYTFSVVATDNNGAASSADSMTVTVLPHTTWRLDAGAVATAVRILRL